jgi:hypothetical protein
MKTIFDKNNSSTRLIVSFILILLLVVMIVGGSAVWLFQSQLDQQAWAQVEQGQRAAIALHGAKYREILNLAKLTGQRPMLQELLAVGDTQALTDYLHTFKNSTDLTRIILCGSDNRILATTDEAVPETLCQDWYTGNYQYNPNIPQACLTAHHPIHNDEGILMGEIFVCNQLDDDFATQISQETGLEHTIWIDDIPVSTSFDFDIAKLEQHHRTIVNQTGRASRHAFEIDGIPYYAAHLPLESSGLGAEVALDISEIQSMSEWFMRVFIVIIFGSVFIGSVLGVLIIRNERDTNV